MRVPLSVCLSAILSCWVSRCFLSFSFFFFFFFFFFSSPRFFLLFALRRASLNIRVDVWLQQQHQRSFVTRYAPPPPPFNGKNERASYSSEFRRAFHSVMRWSLLSSSRRNIQEHRDDRFFAKVFSRQPSFTYPTDERPIRGRTRARATAREREKKRNEDKIAADAYVRFGLVSLGFFHRIITASDSFFVVSRNISFLVFFSFCSRVVVLLASRPLFAWCSFAVCHSRASSFRGF